MSSPVEDDPFLAAINAKSAGDQRRAARHEAGHLLSLARRGFLVGRISIWDSKELLTDGRWFGETLYEPGAVSTISEEAEAALAGAGAEFALAGNEKPPHESNRDVRDAAALLWCEKHGHPRQPGDPDQEQAGLADADIATTLLATWPVIYAEMADQTDRLESIADKILEAPGFALDAEMAAELAGSLLGITVEVMAPLAGAAKAEQGGEESSSDEPGGE